MSRPQPLRFQGDVKFSSEKKKYVLELRNKLGWAHYLGRFKGPVSITIETLRKVRSYKSNRRYWGAVVSTALDEAEQFTGHTKEELHEIFKQRHLQPILAEFQGKKYPLWSTKKLTDGEFVEYCMKVEADLAEMGIRIPTPEEYYIGITKATPGD